MSLPDPDNDPQFYDGVPMRRLIAGLIDMAIIAVLMGLVLLVAMIVGMLTFGLGLFLGLAVFFATGFLYRYVMLVRQSSTLGMMATGIEIRDRAGEPVDQATALVHTAGYYISMLFPALLFGGWLLMLGSPHRRLMHDYIPGTAAINRPL